MAIILSLDRGNLKARWLILVVALLVGASAFFWVRWEQDEPRRSSVHTLQTFCLALNSPDPAAILTNIVTPKAIAGRTVAEQTDFLRKALNSEVSAEGIDALEKHAEFGPLLKIFPNDAERWSSQAGIKPEDCVAFKMLNAGITAEVVLAKDQQSWRVLRCNNVKQMAGGH